MNRRSFLGTLFGAVAAAMLPFAAKSNKFEPIAPVEKGKIGFYVQWVEGAVICNPNALVKVQLV